MGPRRLLSAAALLLAPFVLLLLAQVGVAAAPPPRPPLAEREAVAGKLKVRVFDVLLPGPGAGRPCWLYATDGFRSLRQPELILTVLRRPNEDAKAFSEDPVTFFATIYPPAARGQIVTEGGRIAFDGTRFLGRDDIRGMLYTRPDPQRSALLQPPALALMPVTAAELESAERFGQLRILGLLGVQQRAFPWPAFFDRDRKSVGVPPDEWDTILRKAALVRVPGVRAAAEMPASAGGLVGQGNLVVSFPATGRAAVEEAILRARATPVALEAELDPEADALAVYAPGQKGPAATRSGDGPLSRMAGTFVMFVPGEGEDTAKLYEDGFTITLSEPSRQALHEALATGKDLQLLGAPGSMAIRIRWRD